LAIVNGYCTFDEFAAWTQILGLAKTPQVENVITATSRAIDDYCQRFFWKDGTVGAPVTRTFEACDPYRLDLGARGDLVSVTTLKTDETGDGTFETTWTASDYQLLPFDRPAGYPAEAVEAIAGRPFPIRHGRVGRRDRIQIVGVWGWEAVPAVVNQACLIKANRVFGRHQAVYGVAGVNEFGPIRILPGDNDVIDLLEGVRHTMVHGL
jgi:hypothetical protein